MDLGMTILDLCFSTDISETLSIIRKSSLTLKSAIRCLGFPEILKRNYG